MLYNSRWHLLSYLGDNTFVVHSALPSVLRPSYHRWYQLQWRIYSVSAEVLVFMSLHAHMVSYIVLSNFICCTDLNLFPLTSISSVLHEQCTYSHSLLLSWVRGECTAINFVSLGSSIRYRICRWLLFSSYFALVALSTYSAYVVNTTLCNVVFRLLAFNVPSNTADTSVVQPSSRI